MRGHRLVSGGRSFPPLNIAQATCSSIWCASSGPASRATARGPVAWSRNVLLWTRPRRAGTIRNVSQPPGRQMRSSLMCTPHAPQASPSMAHTFAVRLSVSGVCCDRREGLCQSAHGSGAASVACVPRDETPSVAASCPLCRSTTYGATVCRKLGPCFMDQIWSK